MKQDSLNHIFSVEDIGKDRDHWWNRDFLELMSRRWRLEERRRILDLGCGTGHWSRLLFPFLSNLAVIYGIDYNEELLLKAEREFRSTPYFGRFHAQKGDVRFLPWKAEMFDMVTSQTLWIHLTEVTSALQEVKRILYPGGILAVAEPNNLAQCLFFNSLNQDAIPEAIIQNVRQNLNRERRKRIEGHGDDSIGHQLPECFWKAGFRNIQAYMSDHIDLLYPPYNLPSQKEIVSQMLRENPKNEPLRNALQKHSFFSATPTLLLLISGEKPIC